MNSIFFTSVIKWIASNQGYSFLTSPSKELSHYADAHGVKRPLVYHGAPDENAMIEALKLYVNWRLDQVENHPEITFSKDFGIIKINLIEKEYEKAV